MLEASTGSLGHGLPIAVGMAWSFKLQCKPNKVVCIVGDGEMQEGSNYEALQFAYKYQLDNLLVVIDANNLQGMDFVQDVALDNKTLYEVMCKFTKPEYCYNINGHNEEELKHCFQNFFSNDPKSGFTLSFCNTLKGKGVEIAENQKHYHFRCPTQDGYNVGAQEGNI
jgi:transketolase